MLDKAHIVVDFGGTHLRIAHVDADVAAPKVVPSHAEYARAELRAHFLRELAGYIREFNLDGRLAGINIAIAGQIDADQGVVRKSPNLPSWSDAPVRRWVMQEFGVPVWIDNDVRAASLGELSAPGMEHVRDLVCIYWGTGIGGGIVVAGRLLRGVANAAGEVGHMIYRPEGRRCHCGKAGCYEAYAGGWAIADIARRTVADAPDRDLGVRPTTADVFRLADAGHPVAARIRADAVEALGFLTAGLIVAFNPEVVILGGGLTAHYPAVEAAVREIAGANVLDADKIRLTIQVSRLGDVAALRGAAHLAAHAAQTW